MNPEEERAVIRIVVVDDMEEIRLHLKEELSTDETEVVGTAENGEDGVRLVGELLPDVVLMDIQMRTRTEGLWAIGQIHEQFPRIRCIALTIHEDDEFIFRAYLNGASDYIIKTSETEQIIKSIQAVVNNRLLLRPEVADRLIREYQQMSSMEARYRETMQVMLRISTTEYEILKMAYSGLSYRQIAEERYVEETTVRSQINHILRKFNRKRMKDVIRDLRELHIFEKQE